MSISHLRGAVEWALMLGLVFGAGAIAQAQNEEAESDGRVVQIGQADADETKPAENGEADVAELIQPGFPEQPSQEVSKYWIGLLGGVINDDHPLRAHLDLPANQGLLVADVVPNSPAAKAGLKKHDILLRANDTDLHDMQDLIALVSTEGEKKGQITLEVFRHGNRESVYLTPEERPADANVPQTGGGFGRGAFGFPEGMAGDVFGQLEGGKAPFDFRNFGPGVIVGGGRGFANMPNGVSVSVQKEDGKPAHITVKRGDETWEITGDDPESLKQLPEDLRPFVEQMLQGNTFGRNFQLPNMNLDMRNLPRPQGRVFNDDRLRERLDQMERRMNELLERIGPNDRPADEPSGEDQAK